METFRDAVGVLSTFVLPLMIVGIPLYGLTRRVAVYESFVEGGKEGFTVAVRIIPYLVAILFAIGMFRASGAMEALARALDPLFSLIGFPPELLPMAIVRPLTGSGSAALVADLAATYGADDLRTRMGATHVRLDRDHVLRHRGLLWRRWDQAHAPRDPRRPHRRRLGDAARRLDLPPAVHLSRPECLCVCFRSP